MKLLNGEKAVVVLEKLRDYSLSAIHKDGKHKARVFLSALGLSTDDAEWLRERLLEAAQRHDCVLGKKTSHGQLYVLDFSQTHQEKTARLRSVWIVRTDENSPRLVTCYVL
jgi:hypothetical protein